MSCPLIANADTLRVTRVDACGRPVCGDDNAFVTQCLASVSMAANIEEGTPVEFRAANGRMCGRKPGCPTLLDYGVTLTIFEASPELLEILTGQPVVYGWDGQPIGWDDTQVSCRQGFALELWAEVLGEDVCPEEATGDGAWVLFTLPWVTGGVLGDLEIGSEAVNLTLTGTTRNNSRWGVGPYDVVAQDAAGTPGPFLTPIGPDAHRRVIITTVAPPEPSCEYQPVLCEAS